MSTYLLNNFLFYWILQQFCYWYHSSSANSMAQWYIWHDKLVTFLLSTMTMAGITSAKAEPTTVYTLTNFFSITICAEHKIMTTSINIPSPFLECALVWVHPRPGEWYIVTRCGCNMDGNCVACCTNHSWHDRVVCGSLHSISTQQHTKHFIFKILAVCWKFCFFPLCA